MRLLDVSVLTIHCRSSRSWCLQSSVPYLLHIKCTTVLLWLPPMTITTMSWRWVALAVFTARCYASAVLTMGLCPSSVCVCPCLSVTSRCSTKTAKQRITQTTPHDSPGTLVFWRKRSPRNSTGVSVTPTGAPNAGVGQNRRLSTKNHFISKTVQDRRMVSTKVE